MNPEIGWFKTTTSSYSLTQLLRVRKPGVAELGGCGSGSLMGLQSAWQLGLYSPEGWTGLEELQLRWLTHVAVGWRPQVLVM